MSGLIIDGMSSGLPTGTLIDQLISVERSTQTTLTKRRAEITQAAVAYRAINTKFDALRTAAEAMGKASAWTAAKGTSTATSVTVATTADARAGALTFSVQSTAATHSMVSAGSWAAPGDASGFGGSLEIFNADGSSRGTVTIGGTGTLADTVTALNNSDLGVTAAAVQVSPGQYRLQVTSAASGAAAGFSVGTAGQFAVTTQGRDAQLTVGSGPGAYAVSSPTNAFEGLLPGVTLTVTKPETDVTVSVAADPTAVATSMQTLVDAIGATLGEMKKYSDNAKGSTAPLKGDLTLSRLTGEILNAVSAAVGADGSAAAIGLQLNRDGTIKFDKEKFLTALADDPALAQRLGSGVAAGPGVDGAAGTADDTVAVPGVAARIFDLATRVTDKTTGSLTLLAKGRDDLADDIQDRIDAWDVRLDKRRETLLRQFSAMEVSLSKMKSQSSWLSSQIATLPTYSA